jgi:hypothetical protein
MVSVSVWTINNFPLTAVVARDLISSEEGFHLAYTTSPTRKAGKLQNNIYSAGATKKKVTKMDTYLIE